jgi:hypothetical protein
MKKAQYVCMAIAFIFAGLSAMMWYGEGFHTWCWQVATMIWIADGYLKQKTIDKLEK